MSSPLSISVSGMDEFLASVKQANIDAEPLIRAGLQNSVTEIQRNVRNRAPHRTGSLQRSVLTSVDYPIGTVTVDEVYGQFVEYGTAPHDILPVNKKALFWTGAFNPVKAVHHPGTKANPFFSTGVDASSNYIGSQFSKVIERLVKIMAGH